MSKIALEGNASGTGTLTIASQNTNSNFTLTLPNSSGTVVVTGGAQTIEFAAGTVSAPSITTTGDTNTGIFFPAADTIAFTEGGAEAMRITSGGQLLLNSTAAETTISGSTPIFQVTGAGFNSSGAFTRRENNAFGPGVFLSKSRNTSANSYTIVQNGDSLGSIIFIGDDGTDLDTYGATISAAVDGTPGANDMPGRLVFSTTADGANSPTERMRITSAGNVGVATNSPESDYTMTIQGIAADSSTQLYLKRQGSPQGLFITAGGGVATYNSYEGNNIVFGSHVWTSTKGSTTVERARITSDGDFYLGVAGTNSGVVYIYTGTGDGGRIIDLVNVSGGRYFEVQTDGDVFNANGTYGTISDQKLKQDIVDAGSQWDDIKAIRFRKYRMKTDVAANPDAPALLGVIAQELEQVSPGLVDEHPDTETVEVTDEDGNVTQTQQPTGTTTKTVKSSILLMKAAVALQEAMERIETLEAQNAAFEARLAALENK